MFHVYMYVCPVLPGCPTPGTSLTWGVVAVCGCMWNPSCGWKCMSPKSLLAGVMCTFFESRKQVEIISVIFVWGRCFPKEMIMESMKTQLPKVENRRKRKILSKKIPEYDSSEMKLSSWKFFFFFSLGLAEYKALSLPYFSVAVLIFCYSFNYI